MDSAAERARADFGVVERIEPAELAEVSETIDPRGMVVAPSKLQSVLPDFFEFFDFQRLVGELIRPVGPLDRPVMPLAERAWAERPKHSVPVQRGDAVAPVDFEEPRPAGRTKFDGVGCGVWRGGVRLWSG